MLDLHDPLVQVRVASVTCSMAAILLSLCRLFIHRNKIRVDDVSTIVFSLLALVVQIIAAFLTPKPGTNIGEIRYYMLAYTFFAVLWSARLSILFSLIRINPFPEHQLKLKLLTLLFIIIPCLLTLQCLLTCIPKPEWKTWSVLVCVLDDGSAICQLLGMFPLPVISYIPTCLLMILSDKYLRICLILIFSTCIITSIAGLAHAIEIVKFLHSARIYTAIIENNVALIICNTPILLTSFLNLRESSWEERNSRFSIHELRSTH
ncbi:hypothetical protein AN958_10821 [Leucoagaricus sp. SymC.cos]|nr:hypothetical protein AN958_10821 [Leucoagaricus sp. SymC.cos]